MTPEDITGASLQPKRRLAAEFSKFRAVMKLDELPPTAALALQASYITGAQAAFLILQKASEATREEAILIWGELQQEILTAMPKPPEKKMVVPGRTM